MISRYFVIDYHVPIIRLWGSQKVELKGCFRDGMSESMMTALRSSVLIENSLKQGVVVVLLNVVEVES